MKKPATASTTPSTPAIMPNCFMPGSGVPSAR